MSKLLKYSGDIYRSLRTTNTMIKEAGFDFVTWSNAQTGARFVAKKETVEKLYLNKFENGTFDIATDEIIKISNTGLTVNEMQEQGAGSVTREGWGGKESAKISKKEIDLVAEVLYNKDFDCAVLFEK